MDRSEPVTRRAKVKTYGRRAVWIRCVGTGVRLPCVSAEDPECRGVQQQPGDEEQQVEVSVHFIHLRFPLAHIGVT